jgi:hypothetical protein
MVQDIFQQVDKLLIDLGERVMEVAHESFAIVDGLQEKIKRGDATNNEDVLHGDVGGEHEPLEEEAIVYEPQDPSFDSKVVEDAIRELTTTILIMNLCIVHKVNNKFANELFALLCLHLLLANNCLPNNYYAIKTLTIRLRLDYKNIHACAKGCVLYQEKYKDVLCCPKCGVYRYKDEGNKLFPMKMLKHFPIIPRLQRMFRILSMSELMLWHSQNNGRDGLIRHPCGSKTWRDIHESKFTHRHKDGCLNNTHICQLGWHITLMAK